MNAPTHSSRINGRIEHASEAQPGYTSERVQMSAARCNRADGREGSREHASPGAILARRSGFVGAGDCADERGSPCYKDERSRAWQPATLAVLIADTGF